MPVVTAMQRLAAISKSMPTEHITKRVRPMLSQPRSASPAAAAIRAAN